MRIIKPSFSCSSRVLLASTLLGLVVASPPRWAGFLWEPCSPRRRKKRGPPAQISSKFSSYSYAHAIYCLLNAWSCLFVFICLLDMDTINSTDIFFSSSERPFSYSSGECGDCVTDRVTNRIVGE